MTKTRLNLFIRQQLLVDLNLKYHYIIFIFIFANFSIFAGVNQFRLENILFFTNI